jgi:hypothetical protein
VPFVYIISCCDSYHKWTCWDRAKISFTLFHVLVFLCPPICWGHLEQIVNPGSSFLLAPYLYCIVVSCDVVSFKFIVMYSCLMYTHLRIIRKKFIVLITNNIYYLVLSTFGSSQYVYHDTVRN